MKEECGVAAVYALKNGKPDLTRNVAQYIPKMLLDMQMRGELSAGMTSFNPKRRKLLTSFKRLGTVNEAFRMGYPARFKRLLQQTQGCAAIGHVRYATCGLDDKAYAQPFERKHGRTFKWFAFAFNGQLANYAYLRNQLIKHKGYHIILDTDTEIMMHYISRELLGETKTSMQKVLANLSRDFDGAYSLVFLNADGDLFIARDPHGIKPLCYGIKDDLFAAASESVALANLGFTEIFSLKPGFFVKVNQDGITVDRFGAVSQPAACFFEWVYFANVGSTIDNASVYMARHRLGKALAEVETVPKDDSLIVVPVPDTAKAAADGMGYHLGVPVLEGLMRNRYVGRTFIKGETRKQLVAQKYTPIREVLEGKRVLLVEDSIVRGTTLHHLIKHIREKGRPREIHVRVSSPPILYPCFYGIDMSTVTELFARKHISNMDFTDIPEPVLKIMAHDIGADSLRYMPVNKIPECIGLNKSELCLGCINAQYPTNSGSQLHRLAEEAHEKGDTEKRTYEELMPPAPGSPKQHP